MTIGKQMGLCLCGTVAACVLVGVAGWRSVGELAQRLDESIAGTAQKIEYSSELRGNVLMFRLQERGILLFSFIKSDQQVASCAEAYEKAMSASLADVARIRPLLRTDAELKLIDEIQTAIENYKAHQLEVRGMLARRQVQQATQWDKEKLVPAGAAIMAALNGFNQGEHTLNAQSNDAAGRTEKTAKSVLALGLIGCLGGGLIVGVVLRRSTGKLKETAAELAGAAKEVAGAAAQVSSSSMLLAQGCSEQAATLEETSASTEEINAVAGANAGKTRDAAGLVTRSQHKFEETNRSLEQTVAAMGDIKTQSDKISKIIKVIDEIAFQTNILALNAAVEAARAGEAGMGFAVVAHEVRNLSQRCAQAARDTTALIEESIQKSNDGKSKVDEMAAAIQAITNEAGKVKTLVDEVNLGSLEQARGIEQIGRAITQMEQVTQHTAATAEESASAAEELTAQSDGLNLIVERLRSLAGR